MDKIRLMLITHDLAIGGLQQVVVNICKTLDREKFDVSVLCLRKLGEFAPKIEKLGIEVILLPQKPGAVDYFAFLKVAKILRERKIDVIHTHNTQPLLDGTLGALLAGVKTIVHTDHSRHFPDKWRYMLAEKIMSHFAYKLVGVSYSTSQDLIKYEKISPKKVTTVLNGIDISCFDISIDTEAKKRELGIPGTGPVIGISARLTRAKGINFLLKAIPGIARYYPNVTVVIVGKGEAEDELRQEAQDLGIGNNVLFIGPRLDIPEIMKVFDLCVLPSLREGLPTVLLEAMAAGCPIVATKVGGNATAVIHGENGSLVEAGNSDALMKEIIRLLGNRQVMNKYSQKGLDIVRARFTAEAMTSQYQKLYLREAPEKQAEPSGKIRLMQITHDLAIGGLQQVVVNICKTIDRERFDISVLCLRSLGEFVPEIEKLGIKVMLLPQKRSGVDYFSFLKVARILRERKIDVIHTHNTHPLIDGTLAALLSGVGTIIHTDHARNFPDKKRYMLAERVMSQFIYKMVGVSQATSGDLMKYEKISPHKIITVLNGIDGSKFDITVDRQAKKKEIGITVDGPVIGLGVRLTIQKGITYLLRAMPEIIRHYPDITLVIAGEGDFEKELREIASEIGVEGNTLFIGPRLDMPEILKILDIYVLPSLWEGLPMVLLEAMASGCPIVATDVGGNSGAVVNGESGALVEPGSSDALARKIIRLLGDEALRNSYAQKGRELFMSRFTARRMTEQYEKLYCRESLTDKPA
jgi:glycosyltransferase involved in cell wall biosynthesis